MWKTVINYSKPHQKPNISIYKESRMIKKNKIEVTCTQFFIHIFFICMVEKIFVNFNNFINISNFVYCWSFTVLVLFENFRRNLLFNKKNRWQQWSLKEKNMYHCWTG